LCAEAHQVDRQLVQIDRDLARGLRRVDVQHDAARAAQLADRGDVLDHADLVVDEHHRDEQRVGADRGGQHIEVEQPVRLDVEIAHLEALALEFAHRVEHGLVFGAHGDQVLAARCVELRGALDRQVVRLRRAGGEDDLARIGPDQCRHVLAGDLHGLLGRPTVGMAARRRIAELLVQVGHHRVDDAWIDRSGGRVVQVDRLVFELEFHVGSAVACDLPSQGTCQFGLNRPDL